MTDKAVAGVSASGLSFLVTIIIQFGSVPLLLLALGVEKYGLWLTLSAIPSYLSMTDFGIAGAAATQASMHAAQGRLSEARDSLESSWNAIARVSIPLGILLPPIVAIAPLPEGIAAPSLRLALIALCFSILLWLNIGFIEAAFRAQGEFPRSQVLLNVIRVLDFLVTAAAALISHKLLVMALAAVLIKLVLVVFYYRQARRVAPWFRLALRRRIGPGIQAVWRPGLGYLGFPVATALTNQGTTLAVASMLGPRAVVLFTVTRTVASVSRQVVNVVNLGVLSEVTLALARREMQRATNLFRRAALSSFVVSAFLGLVTFLLKDWVFLVWTNGRVIADTLLLVLFLLTVLADVPWQSASNVLIASNKHSILAMSFVASSTVSLALGAWGISRWGISAMPAAFFFVDLVLTPVAFIGVRRCLDPASARRSDRESSDGSQMYGAVEESNV